MVHHHRYRSSDSKTKNKKKHTHKPNLVENPRFWNNLDISFSNEILFSSSTVRNAKMFDVLYCLIISEINIV